MWNKYLSNITLRMIGLVGLLHLVLFASLYFGLGMLVEDGYRSQFVDYVRSDAFNLAAGLANVSDEDNVDINTRILEEALLAGSIAYVQVLDNNDQVVQVLGDVERTTPFIEDFEFANGSDKRYHIAAAAYDAAGSYRGQLRLGYDETGTLEKIDSAYARILTFSTSYVILALLVTIFCGRKLTRPIQDLQALSSKIAQGEYQTEITVATGVAEISSLSSSLEFMRRKLVEQSEYLEYQGLHDHLTGLPNRILLEDRVNQLIGNRELAGEPSVLVIIDLDRFKEVNDTLGHPAGDSVLQQASNRLVEALRKTDTVARLGGDEFAVFLPGTDLAGGLKLVKDLLFVLTQTYFCDEQPVSLGASFGLAVYPKDGTKYEELLKCADVAMYAAKRAGTGSVQIYQTALDQDALERLTIVADLREALEDGQLFAVYQPKMALIGGGVDGVEVLARWQHPKRGLVMPDEFVPAVERGGLVAQFTYWVLRAAISQVAKWRDQGIDVPVAVNISPENLTEDNFSQSIIALLEEYAVPAGFLELEITESTFLADPEKAKTILEGLSDAGVKLSIDDFGTGFSSLGQLRQMPVTVLKIDRCFVGSMEANEGDAAIVRAIVSMAHELGLTVVAEGVEDVATLNSLRKLDCDVVQGYLFAKPMAAAEFERWLREAPSINKIVAATDPANYGLSQNDLFAHRA